MGAEQSKETEFKHEGTVEFSVSTFLGSSELLLTLPIPGEEESSYSSWRNGGDDTSNSEDSGGSVEPSSVDLGGSVEPSSVDLLMTKIHDHQSLAQSSFDLVASNSFCSKAVRQIMSTPLMNSYCIGMPGDRFYGGCTHIDDIERQTRKTLCDLFGSKYCEVQLLSGMMANIAAYNAMLPRTGLTVMASPGKHGGHYSHNTGGPLSCVFKAKIVSTPWDDKTYNINTKLLAVAMKKHKPKLLIVGWSEMLFEHDLPAISRICKHYKCKLMYDMSHVAGLVAGGVFQRDLMKYADIVTSSTGKSLHSPDHGIVLYNDESLTPKIRETVMPILTSNTHFHETAALCMTLLEMKTFGNAYARQVVANTRALARSLVKQEESGGKSFKILCADLGYSRTHELIVDLQGKSGVEATEVLDKAGIFVNPQDLPNDTAHSGPTGLRLGTQVLTRRGFKEADMTSVALAIVEALNGQESENVQSVSDMVAAKCEQFKGEDFSFSQDFIN